MSSQVQICNLALRRIAAQPIVSLTEGSEEANVMNDIFDMLYKKELRSYPWRWASVTATLAEIASESPPDFAYVHQLPADYLQMQLIIESVTGETLYDVWDELYGKHSLRNQEWEVRQGKLYSNWSDVKIKYTQLVTDYAKLDPTFVEAFAWKLAMEGAPTITTREGLVQKAFQMYQLSINEARGQDGIEQRRRLNISREYLGARHFIRR